MKPEELMQKAGQLGPALLEERRYLHRNAETGFDLEKTVAFVKSELQKAGVRPVDCGRAGVTALIGGKRPGKTFLLRADMDALPIGEEADLPFACNSGRIHACGHDLHTAMLLGAARLLKLYEPALNGTVKLMFQPAEELLEGAQEMIRAGVLEAPKPDAALMLHVLAGIPFPAGTVLISSPGASAPAADYFEIQVQGAGCHGSMPNTGVDPLSAAAHILIGLQEIHARELAMDDRAALTIGTIAAGSAANVIPDCVTMAGTSRAFDEQTRSFIKQRTAEIAQATAEAFRARASIRYTGGCPALLNNKALAACAETYAAELLGRGKAVAAGKAAGDRQAKTSGSEDFAYISQQVPSVMLALAAGSPQAGYRYPLHHPQVTFDEAVLPIGSAVYAYTAMRWLEDHP